MLYSIRIDNSSAASGVAPTITEILNVDLTYCSKFYYKLRIN